MGAIRDVTNSFNIPFVIAGISFVVSALMHFVVMWLMNREAAAAVQKKNEKAVTSVTNPSAGVNV